MTTILTGIFVILVSTVAAVGGFLVADRCVSIDVRSRHNDVAGFIYAFLGPLYAILLAFVVFVVWGYFDMARSAAAAEATALYKVVSISRGMDSTFTTQIQGLTVAYGDSVIDDEWPVLARGNVQSLVTRQKYVQLRDAVEAYSPRNERDNDLYQAELANLEELAGARNERLLKAEDVLHPALWVALIVGAMVSVGYAYVFGIENRKAHILMIAVLAFSISGLLFLIKTIDGPFKGDLKVQPNAMRETVEIINGVFGPP